MDGADLRDSTVTLAGFDDNEVAGGKVAGMRGTVVGSVVTLENGEEIRLDGARLERWLRQNGAEVSAVN